jgi:hypothetical protein
VERWALLVGLLAGCSDGPPPPTEEPVDQTRAPIAPEVCSLSELPSLCIDGMGEIETAFGGAGGLGGAGPVGEASCILGQKATLFCPSLLSRLALGRGSHGELDVVTGQKGRDGREASGTTYADERLHLSTYRLPLGEALAAPVPFPPIDEGGLVSVGVVPGNADGDSLLLLHRTAEHPEAQLTFSEALSAGAEVWTLPAAALGQAPVGAAGPGGERFVFELVPSAAGLITLSSDAAERVELGAVQALAVDVDAAGEPYLLLHQEGDLRLLAGQQHDDLLWSEPRPDGTGANIDLLVGGGGAADRRYVLVLDGQNSYPQLRVQEGAELPAQAGLARGERGCDGWTLNFDCETCPVGTACENNDFLTRGARLFAHGERVLLAVHWAERVDFRVTDTDTSFIGICVCDSTLVESAVVAEYLSIYDIGYRGPETSLDLTLVWEEQIGSGNEVGAFGFARDAGDGLDFWYGPYLAQADSGVADFPESGRGYVIQHFGNAPRD